MNLVLIETSGNQSYIFATNKLRENVGASELTYRVGTEWTLEAVMEVGGEDLWNEKADLLRQNLLNQKAIGEDGSPVEVIIATSGKALLLVQDRKIGKEIVQQVTAKALKCAPGIDVCGVVSNDFDWETCPLGNVNLRVHEMFGEVRAARPAPAMRFLRLPVVAECATSGLPAKEWYIPGKMDREPAAARSAVSLAKRDHRQRYEKRMLALLDRKQTGLQFAKDVDEVSGREKNVYKQLEEQAGWVSVIHADGNGLGSVFLDFGKHSGCSEASQNRQYVNKLRRFSLAIDICTENAFLEALHGVIGNDPDNWFRLPILPIVLGGDDLTVVCDGRVALNFTRDFLMQFEHITAQPVGILETDTKEEKRIITDIVESRLSACAGVSVIKPHYPFSAAYDLAEDLIRSAKRVKDLVKQPSGDKSWPCSALDFHIHYDSSGSDLDGIRERLVVEKTDESETRLHSRPYVVTSLEELTGDVKGKDWARLHHWGELQKRVGAITATDEEGRRQLPNSQIHDLRAGLFLGRAVADARYKLIRHRYENEKEKVISIFDGDPKGTLFELERAADQANDKQKNKQVYLTKLLDAVDVATLHDAKLAESRVKSATQNDEQGECNE